MQLRFFSKGGVSFVAILSCCNLCQPLFLELFLSSKKPWFFFFGILSPAQLRTVQKQPLFGQKKSLTAANRPTKKTGRFWAQKSTDGPFVALGGTSCQANRGLANETDLGILVFPFWKTWANDAMRKNLQKKIWAIADNDDCNFFVGS